MRRNFSIKLGKKLRAFAGINRFLIPYLGIRHGSRKTNSQSLTVSPLRKTAYTKTKIKDWKLKTKTNIDTLSTKLKLRRRK